MGQPSELTIVNSTLATQGYPFEAIDERALVAINSSLASGPAHHRKFGEISIRLFECFLEVTDRKFTLAHFEDGRGLELIELFIAALHSRTFSSRSSGAISTSSRAFLTAMSALHPSLTHFGLESGIAPGAIASIVAKHQGKFEEASLNEEAVWLWRGWPCTDRTGTQTYLPLFGIYKKLGRPFTSKFHHVCETYVGSRRRSAVPCLPQLCAFLESHPHETLANALRNPAFVRTFLQDFLKYFVEERYANGNGSRLSTIITEWNHHFVVFARDHLIAGGLIAEPYGAIPQPQNRKVSGAKTKIRKTAIGTEVKTNLLTEIPLHVSDQEALNLLFRDIGNDFRNVVKWAEFETSAMWERYQQRKSLAPAGTVRVIQPWREFSRGNAKWITSRANPDWLQNAAATFEHYGFTGSTGGDPFVLYASPLAETASALGIPTVYSLLPHASLLVADHPEITPAFLEELELFDKHGKRTGFVENDAGCLLVSCKRRRGAEDAQQAIVLNTRTTELVRQIIALTDPLRDHLRRIGSDKWRLLFLTGSFGFEPRTQKFSHQTSNPRCKESLEKRFALACGMEPTDCRRLVAMFSLRSLRASKGVLIYLERGSAEDMAKALGHKSCNSKLIEHYLPKPILEFFQERWIRLFQTGLVVEALKDSAYLLEASAFSSMSELDAFLREHAIKAIPRHLQDPEDRGSLEGASLRKSVEVAFGVDEGILTLLLSIEQAVAGTREGVSGLAIYWAEISKRLAAFIDSSTDRPDLRKYLAVARVRATPARVEPLLYGQA